MTDEKVWQYHPNGCDECGGDVYISTNEGLEEGWGYDGDPIRCTDCGAKGKLVVADEDYCWVAWDEDQ